LYSQAGKDPPKYERRKIDLTSKIADAAQVETLIGGLTPDDLKQLECFVMTLKVMGTENEVAQCEGDDLPLMLRLLMAQDNVTENEIQAIVSQKGYYSIGTPISKYSKTFVDGILIGVWDFIFNLIEKKRKGVH
jgi:hypothetical protein